MTARLRALADEILSDLERDGHEPGACYACDERRRVLAELEAEVLLVQLEPVHGR